MLFKWHSVVSRPQGETLSMHGLHFAEVFSRGVFGKGAIHGDGSCMNLLTSTSLERDIIH